MTTTPTTTPEPIDGYWYCPTTIYPRWDGIPAPEEGCSPTEPVIVSEDGLTATGTFTGVARPLPTSLPSTGFESTLLIVAVGCVAVGGLLRRIARLS